MKKALLFYIVFIILGIQIPGISQDHTEIKRPVFVGIKTHFTGLIIAHRDTLKDIASSTPRGVQVDLSRFNISEKSWKSCNCYARTGFSYAFYDYGNPKQLGQSHNLIFFLEPYFNVNQKLKFSYRAGMGLSYLTKPYDPIDNRANLFYSSVLSYLLFVNAQMNFNVSESVNLNAGLFYNHISNGGMKQPNLGMNFPTLSIGADYILHPSGKRLEKYQKDMAFDKSLKKYARLFSSIKTVDAPDTTYENEQKPVIGIEVGALKPIGKINAVSLGAEMVWDESWKLRNERWDADFDHRTFNILVGHNFILGNFIFNQQLGWYAFKNFPNTNSLFFQRYGLFYQFGNYVNLGFTLKSHLEVAEIMDVRMGVIF